MSCDDFEIITSKINNIQNNTISNFNRANLKLIDINMIENSVKQTSRLKLKIKSKISSKSLIKNIDKRLIHERMENNKMCNRQ